MGKTFEIDMADPKTFEIDMAPPPKRSFGQELGRQVGLTARAGIEGAMAIPAAIADTPTIVRRSLGAQSAIPFTNRTSMEALSHNLTALGLPEPETTQEKIVGGVAGAMIPMEGAVKLSDIGVSGGLKAGATSLMQSAIKPTLSQLKSGDAAVAIDTVLKKGIPLSERGVRMIREQIDNLNDQIANAISNSKETVSKSGALRNLVETLQRFRNQVNPQADMDAVYKSWERFRDHPLLAGSNKIPVQLAQELKKGTYRELRGKYGEMGNAEVESQKAIARSLKDQIGLKVPDVVQLNAAESKLIKTLDVVERRTLLDMNKDPGGLTFLAHNPKAAMAFMAGRSKAFKSLAARMLYRDANQTADDAMRRAGGAATEMSLYDLSHQDQQ